jgi:hypothetical protein
VYRRRRGALEALLSESDMNFDWLYFSDIAAFHHETCAA